MAPRRPLNCFLHSLIAPWSDAWGYNTLADPPFARLFLTASTQRVESSVRWDCMQARRFATSWITASQNLIASDRHASRTAAGTACAALERHRMMTNDEAARNIDHSQKSKWMLKLSRSMPMSTTMPCPRLSPAVADDRVRRPEHRMSVSEDRFALFVCEALAVHQCDHRLAECLAARQRGIDGLPME
jgi:hypothetical protein